MELLPMVGVDLGGTNVRAAVVDRSGSILAAARQRLDGDRLLAGVVQQTISAIHQALGASGRTLEQVKGVGIGVAGQIRGDSGVVANAPNLGWREVPLGALLSDKLGRPVKVVNDVEAITWGEVSFGAALGCRNVLVVFPGTGIGAGLVINGALYRGATGVAAEIGHVKVVPDGDPCGCGSRGCLEAYLGGGNLSRWLQQEARNGWSALQDRAGTDLAGIHPGLLEPLVLQGESRAVELWKRLAGYFGLVLANAVTLLNPEVLVLGGTVLNGCPTLRKWSEEVFARQVLAVSHEAVRIVSAKLGDDGGMIGAASLSMDS